MLGLMHCNQTNSQPRLSTRAKRSRKDISKVVEFTRKLMYALNGDSPSNISFGEINDRVYFLGGTRKGDITIKYVDMNSSTPGGEKLVGKTLLDETTQQPQSDATRQLTKEEQLLRERKRCSFNGITSFCLEPNASRLVFSENSDLFYFDDKHVTNGSSHEQPIITSAKG